MAAGAVSLKKPHHIITLRFSDVVKDRAKYLQCTTTLHWVGTTYVCI